ncbi:MAG: hypothetical protein BEN19_08915 [Epulopiscium sp. Nuni2H_MBin003]|nr:MAG: hypothetical protein BEN19_08915 [Epulopiscium sp. Nuni2H_MBin003]
MDLYLLTGFLGAGKTTTISEILKIWQDKKVALIINEFGKAGVDGKILDDTSYLSEITGGSIFCTCKINQFENVLINIIQQKPEIIIVEASGLSDPTSAYQILDKFDEVIYKGCICIVDAYYFEKVIRTAKVSKKQVRISDAIIINKQDLVEEDKIEEVKKLIYMHNPYATIHRTAFGKIDSEWIMELEPTRKEDAGIKTRDITLQKYMLHLSEACSYNQLVKMLEVFIEDTYRVKGFVKIEDGNFLVDCVGDSIIVKPYEGEVLENLLVILSGDGLPAYKNLKKAKEMYCKQILKIER